MGNSKEAGGNKYFDKHIKSDDFMKFSEKLGLFTQEKIGIYKSYRLEARTRKENSETALSFAIHDPLWMLTRQWQFGEFKGDDCGSAIWAKIKIEHSHIDSISNGENIQNLDSKDALEYYVERMNVQITDAIKVEAAYHFKKSMDFSTLKNKASEIFKILQSKYPLESFPEETTDSADSGKTTKESMSEIKKQKNTRLASYLAAFSSRSFDGFALYTELSSTKIPKKISDILSSIEHDSFKKICSDYSKWFKESYLPIEEFNNFWKDEKLSYELSAKDKANDKKYSVEDYHSGRLSWYSFDLDKENSSSTDVEKGNIIEKYMTFIPTLAEFPGSPNKRLWAFEDAKVAMGNSELNSESLANALILQYTTMYGNDWLITPMELKAGMISQVKGIIVTDVFGKRYFIDNPAGDSSLNEHYSGKWEMFTTSMKDAYEKQDFTTDGRLLFPPALTRTEESEPIEEVQFLRDEMANMIWAVETKINDDCGKSMDGDQYAAEIAEALEALTPKHGNEEETKADYKFLFQNSVPLNWIPFSPVKFKPGEPNAIREIRFQRSTMPLFVKDGFVPIRPNTQLMRTGINENDQVKEHKFINEEEILAVGTKVVITNQRTRWIKGKTFNWQGAKKEISRTQANSGLTFDELVEVVSKSASKIDLTKEE